MSYDVGFNDAEGNRVRTEERHQLRGGTYCIGSVAELPGGRYVSPGTREAWLNVTYNYSPYFYRMWPEGGLRSLYGKTAKEMAAILESVLYKDDPQVPVDIDQSPCSCHQSYTCYWAVTRANVVDCLTNLRILATLVPPDSIFQGD